MKYIFLTILIFHIGILHSQEFKLKKVETNLSSSFRGLAVIDDNVAWLSGSEGWVGVTGNGGKAWHFNQVNGFEEFDFRSIYAFDEQRAIIANAGSPANILYTSNGGKSWKSVYANKHKDAFFDGIDFWNENEGIIYGDPIDGRMLVLYTTDGGQNWTEIENSPHLEKGEASFAASGTCIRCMNKKDVAICTGGVVSRLWTSRDRGEHWLPVHTPIVQGEASTGIFSFVKSNKAIVIVGGDFKNEAMNTSHNFYSQDNGRTWLTPPNPTRGYRECVEPVTKNILIATGPSGIDISYDNGVHWKGFSDEKGLHVVRKARKGSLAIVAGAKGKVFLIQL
jgi:photosystem II stability/assembly factor-like uncharacterized protein